MPKSKRNQTFHMTKTDKKGREGKENLFTQVRECVDKYEHVYVFQVENMRNTFMKEVRNEWKTSSNRVMAKALGQTEEDEYQENLRSIAAKLTGNVGLLFTDAAAEELQAYFKEYCEKDFARGGAVAVEEVTIPKGPLMRHNLNMPNNMEPMLRKLGMPTELKEGIMCLRSDYTICKKGQTLTPEQAVLLKHFGVQMADFKIHIQCCWTKGGEFEEF